MIPSTLALTQTLMQLPSITPEDAGCQTIITELLAKAGFVTEQLNFGEVKNLWAKRGTSTPLLLFAGHTDVVPTGPLEEWCSPPFEPTIRGDYLYGRGATDMKGSLAAMVIASLQFIEQYPQHRGSIGFLITSDEEGPAIEGTKKVIEHLQTQGEQLTWCVVGEPSSEKQLGDMVKVGRRGSLGCRLTVQGKQGHIAYPHLANNPIHAALPALMALIREPWDNGNANFPPTSLQFSNISAGVGVTNVIPGHLDAIFNFRYSTQTSAEKLKERVIAILDQYELSYTLDWRHSGLPFLTQEGDLLKATRSAIHKVTQLEPILSTTGGTSDGRFIAATGCEVIELGVCNNSIHQINEYVRIQDLELLTQIYRELLIELLV